MVNYNRTALRTTTLGPLAAREMEYTGLVLGFVPIRGINLLARDGSYLYGVGYVPILDFEFSLYLDDYNLVRTSFLPGAAKQTVLDGNARQLPVMIDIARGVTQSLSRLVKREAVEE